MQRIAGALVAGAVLIALGLLYGGWPGKTSAVPRVAADAASSDPAVDRQDLQTVRLSVDNMWCPSCPYIVQQALMAAPGVVDAKVSGRTETAIVTFDPTKASISDLTAATERYGYPSRLLGS